MLSRFLFNGHERFRLGGGYVSSSGLVPVGLADCGCLGVAHWYACGASVLRELSADYVLSAPEVGVVCFLLSALLTRSAVKYYLPSQLTAIHLCAVYVRAVLCCAVRSAAVLSA